VSVRQSIFDRRRCFSGDSEQIPLILSAVVVFTFLVMVLLMILVWHWRRRARAKETAVKMTMVLTGMEDNEPLRPSNVKPNTAKLRIVKEVDLRIGSELGNGAFGVVYKVQNISIATSNNRVHCISQHDFTRLHDICS